MANILVLGVKVPFTSGGQEVLVRTLVRELAKREHCVDLVELPFNPSPKEHLLKHAALWRSLDLDQFGGSTVDLVIATKFPSYYARHPRKSLWLVHQHRSLYDLYCGRYSDISDDPRDEQLRRALVEGDDRVLRECSFISGISRNVVRRLKTFNSLEGVPLYPPLPLGNRYRQGANGDYILSVGRLCAIKRVDLAIKALPIVHNFVKLKIVGTPDEPGIMEYYQNEVAKHHLWDRVEFLGRVSDEELIDLYANALAVFYAPHNEDYGYVTLEAFASAKCVLTASDSGGVLEFVRDMENGLVLEPTPDAMGHGMMRLAEDPELAVRLGDNGLGEVRELGITESGWDRVISSLLSPIAGPPGK